VSLNSDISRLPLPLQCDLVADVTASLNEALDGHAYIAVIVATSSIKVVAPLYFTVYAGAVCAWRNVNFAAKGKEESYQVSVFNRDPVVFDCVSRL
jgi:hypothetical protein